MASKLEEPSPQSQPTTSPSSADPTSDRFIRYLKNDPSRTGFSPDSPWWLNLFKICTNQVTNEGAFHYREWRYKVNEAKDCERCEKNRDWLLQNSPIVKFLGEKVSDLNGKLDASNILCRRCPARLTEDGQVHRQGGGFSPQHGILLCANEMRDWKHLEDTLAHEMVHAWDHLRWKMDATNNLRHAACTEIRASMLSGECRWTREFFTRHNIQLTQQFQNCVRMRAIKSVMARPSCKDDVQATKVVNEVWDSCYSDTRPFDEVYK